MLADDCDKADEVTAPCRTVSNHRQTICRMRGSEPLNRFNTKFLGVMVSMEGVLTGVDVSQLHRIGGAHIHLLRL